MDDIDALTRGKLPTVRPDERIGRVALALSRTRANVAFVSTEKEFIGVVPRRSLLRPPLASDMKAERLVSHPPSLKTGAGIPDAVSLALQSGYDLLPVLERNRLIGGVNARELAYELRSLPDTQLGEIGHLTSPLTEDLVILEAAARMRVSDSESMPIVDQGGALTGWVNFSDIFRYVISPERGVRGTGEFVGEKIHPGKNPVSSISDSVGVTATADMTAPQAVELLYKTRRNEATVIEDGLVLGQISILGILSVTRERSDVLIQVAGLEEEDPFVVNQITGNMRATALKLGRMCRNMSTPEIKVKSYEHGGSSRRRYEVRVTFSIPERYVAEAKGWDLLSTSQRALKRVEREIIRNRSKLIDSHRHRGSPPNEE